MPGPDPERDEDGRLANASPAAGPKEPAGHTHPNLLGAHSVRRFVAANPIVSLSPHFGASPVASLRGQRSFMARSDTLSVTHQVPCQLGTRLGCSSSTSGGQRGAWTGGYKDSCEVRPFLQSSWTLLNLLPSPLSSFFRHASNPRVLRRPFCCLLGLRFLDPIQPAQDPRKEWPPRLPRTCRTRSRR